MKKGVDKDGLYFLDYINPISQIVTILFHERLITIIRIKHMRISKRDFLALSGVTAGAVAVGAWSPAALSAQKANLSTITDDVKPITVEERLARIAKAQRLMAKNGIDAILLEPGSAMLYFSGVSWWRSERLTTVIIPREGDIGIVTPFFEEPSVRESMTFGDDVRAWNEHENPFDLVAGFLKDRNLSGGKIGLEETVRYFVVDGMKSAAPSFEITSRGVVCTSQ
jgi:Xaa-Pro dipeptidase